MLSSLVFLGITGNGAVAFDFYDLTTDHGILSGLADGDQAGDFAGGTFLVEIMNNVLGVGLSEYRIARVPSKNL